MPDPIIDDPMDLNTPVPDTYDALVKALSGVVKSGVRYSKKLGWNIGRHVAALMDSPEKYGKKSIENLEADLRMKKSQLYNYATVFRAYTPAALERVYKRDKVNMTHMIFLAKLPTDGERDTAEKRVQNSDPPMAKDDVERMVNQMLGTKPPKGPKAAPKPGGGGEEGDEPPTPKPQAPEEFYEAHALAMTSIVEEAANTGMQLEKAFKGGGIEKMPVKARNARKTYHKKLLEVSEKLRKIADNIEKNGL